MYSIYLKQKEQNGCRYSFKKRISLFGCNSGRIPYLLQKKLASDAAEPLNWELDLKDALAREGAEDHVFIINLMPNKKDKKLSLYELVKVWGRSASGWTPIMIYIRGLFIEADFGKYNEKDFFRKPAEITDPLFSMMYLNGTIKEGKISGKWIPPGPSPTNSVLLWPDTFRYFSSEAQKIIDSTASG